MRPYWGYYETLCEDEMPLLRFAVGLYSERISPCGAFEIAFDNFPLDGGAMPL